MKFSKNDFPKLDKSIKSLISQGVYSFYYTDTKRFLLKTPGPCQCCSPSAKAASYLIKQDGEIEEALSAEDNNHTPVEVIQFCD